MEVLLVLVGGAIGIASAVLTTWLNNRSERERLHDTWKQQRQERQAAAKRQRLEGKLVVVRESIYKLLQWLAMLDGQFTGIVSTEETTALGADILRTSAQTKATAIATLDQHVAVAVRDLYDSLGPAIEAANFATADESWPRYLDDMIDKASLVLKRCDELIEQTHDKAADGP